LNIELSVESTTVLTPSISVRCLVRQDHNDEVVVPRRWTASAYVQSPFENKKPSSR